MGSWCHPSDVLFPSADPSGWDPIYGKSPVHLAGRLHSVALGRVLGSNGDGKERS